MKGGGEFRLRILGGGFGSGVTDRFIATRDEMTVKSQRRDTNHGLISLNPFEPEPAKVVSFSEWWELYLGLHR